MWISGTCPLTMRGVKYPPQRPRSRRRVSPSGDVAATWRRFGGRTGALAHWRTKKSAPAKRRGGMLSHIAGRKCSRLIWGKDYAPVISASTKSLKDCHFSADTLGNESFFAESIAAKTFSSVKPFLTGAGRNMPKIRT